MGSRARFIVVAAVLAAGGVAGVLLAGSNDPNGADGDGTFATGTAPSVPLPAQCFDLPQEVPRPSWFPADLPLPEGSYPSLIPEQRAPGIREIVFTARGSLDDFVRFVLDRWEEAGWSLGRGEREPGEAESIFFAGEAERYGQFRARQVYCDEDYTEVQLIVVLEPQPTPTPLIASPTPS